MNGARKPNAMLIELVIVILFFSISAGIILQLFVAASNKSVQNNVDNAALMLAEDFAERLAASGEALDDFLLADGWTDEALTHEKTVEAGNRTFRMVVDGASEASDGGMLDEMNLTIMDGSRTAVSLPVCRYIPEEVTP